MSDFGAALRVFARSRKTGRLLVPVAVLLVVQLLGATELVKLPFGDATARLAPVMPALWATLIGSVVVRRSPELEWFDTSRLSSLRLAWSCVLTITIALTTESLNQLRGVDAVGVQTRNSLFFVGIAFLAAVVFAPRYLWLPVVGVAITVFALGLDPSNAAPYDWALPYQPPTKFLYWAVASILAVIGIASYTAKDSRPTKGLIEK